MWTITVFEQETFRIFQYEQRSEAMDALKKFDHNAILTFTNPF